MMNNSRWILRRRPNATLVSSDLELVETAPPVPGDDELLVRNIYLSLDPTNRLWMSDREQYLPPVQIGDVMRGMTIGIVEHSNSPRFAAGDIVLLGEGGWQRYVCAKARAARKLQPEPGIPLTAYLSALGPTGLTAYFGLLDIGRPQPGETVVVSAAAGAVGSIVGQIAKIKGARVVGIAGSKAKCDWLTDELGFDGAIDYKSEDVEDALDRLCPDGIDVNFENVGGSIMSAVFDRMNRNGRVALCGFISSYNDEGPVAGPRDFGRILMQRLTVRGFIVIDYLPQIEEAFADLSRWIAEGRIKWKDHVVQGLDQAPDSLNLLFSGGNDGKLIVELD